MLLNNSSDVLGSRRNSFLRKPIVQFSTSLNWLSASGAQACKLRLQSHATLRQTRASRDQCQCRQPPSLQLLSKPLAVCTQIRERAAALQTQIVADNPFNHRRIKFGLL